MPEALFGKAFETLLEALGEGVYIIDENRRIIFWNEAAERITGFGKGEVLGRRCADNILVHVDDTGRELCTGCCPLAATIRDSAPRRSRVFLHHREGHRVAVDVQTLRLVLDDGSAAGAEIFTETGSREALLDQIGELQRLSLADPLTGLPNRRQMEAVIAARLAAMQRSGIPFGAVFMDIDRFKQVNDMHGHLTGDRVLVTVARTLLASVRPFDTVGRWGGEEFLGVFPGISGENLLEIAERLRNLVAVSKTTCEGREVTVTISAGATMALPHDDERTLVERADSLMYQGKNAGRNRVVGDRS